MPEGVDVSRIQPHLLKTNDVVLLDMPDGFIPIRVLRTEFFNYLYDPIAEGQLPNEVSPSSSTDSAKNVGFYAPELLKSGIIASQPINVLRVSEPSTLYQVFVGVAPSYARIFLALPATASQRNLDVINWSVAYAAAGFIDGYTSPLTCPSPDSEFIVLSQMDPAIGYANILFEPIRPLLWFYLNKVRFGVLLDVDLVMEAMEKRGRGAEAKIKTVGGFTRFTYQYREVFRINPIPPGATREQISQILMAPGRR
ncbi:MAG: hypothetical protein NZ957_02435 [Thaumarchaeota archaeon]|nr:hypothetical protein [Candidatus Calditenuaceae archaeon]